MHSHTSHDVVWQHHFLALRDSGCRYVDARGCVNGPLARLRNHHDNSSRQLLSDRRGGDELPLDVLSNRPAQRHQIGAAGLGEWCAKRRRGRAAVAVQAEFQGGDGSRVGQTTAQVLSTRAHLVSVLCKCMVFGVNVRLLFGCCSIICRKSCSRTTWRKRAWRLATHLV